MLIFGALELGLRLALPGPVASQTHFTTEILRRLYSADELSSDLPMFLARQGGQCVRTDNSRLHWNSRFGFASKTLDKECAKNLFKSSKFSVVLLGGSTMANIGTPNYLTSLDYYAFGTDDKIASINLSEPGARLSNMLARFSEEVVELRPDVVVALVGANEFVSISYGGLPGDDLHWTMGVRRRVETPIMGLIDNVLNQSRLAQVALIGTGIFPSSRRIPNKIDHALVDQDVNIYLRAWESMRALCGYYGIKCLFVLQPIPMIQENPNGTTAAIVQERLKLFPHDRDIYTRGYALIRQRNEKLLDASKILDEVADAYLDLGHLTKVGNAALAKFIYNAVIRSLDPSNLQRR
jgi:hypothetical protein